MNQKWYRWIAIFLFLLVGVWLGMRMNSYQEITLYFPDANGEWQVVESRRVLRVDETQLPDLLIEELIKGPNQDGLVPSIPTGTLLLPLETEIPKVMIENNIAKVNFSSDFKQNHQGGSTGELMTLGSIVNTLTQIEGIDKVQIYVNGQIIESLAGHWPLNEPIARMEQLIK